MNRSFREPVHVRAPSNIALIKYMGKKEEEENLGKNLPENASLSMTLSQLCTEVKISPLISDAPGDCMVDLAQISEQGKERFLSHLNRFRKNASELSQKIQMEFSGVDEPVEIWSKNTFPHSVGIASSASSFAALTFACFYYFARDRVEFQKRLENDDSLREVMAQFSRLGSGSSCRSFFGPFCSWQWEQVFRQPSQLPPLVDLILLVSNAPKKISSSEAHRKVKDSAEWRGRRGHLSRPERANARFHQMTRALYEGHFSLIAALAYDDFTDMHELFHTAQPPWTYLTNETKRLLSFLESLSVGGASLIVTMDAGPNIHVLVPENDALRIEKKILTRFPELRMLKDRASLGPEIL